MMLSSTMYQTESYLNLHHNNNNENLLIHQQMNKETSTLSNRFGYSIHNCFCKKSKTGLVLYPIDKQMKNIILLVCKPCYDYQSENGTQHIQLEKWYFNIYKDSKSFQFKSKFSQNEDGSFCFYNFILNLNESFNIKERELENWEKDTIQRIVERKCIN